MPDAVFPRPLRLILSAGARLDPSLQHDFHARFGRKIHSFYGSSESGGIAFDAGATVEDPVTLGRPLEGVTIDLRPEGIHDAADKATARRVHVRSAAVGLGYALDPDSTAAAFVDGGFLTGDLGALDADGRLFLSGRVSQFINVAGRKVNVDEVERILTSMPGVVQARVVDVPCATRGQALVACVVLDDPAPTALEMRAYCARRLSPHKIPRDIVPVAALPVDARGKIDRRALAELAATRARV
jgi:acyl-coenzyme A synthetase/AMP-(fatty) acid ligase